MHRLRRGVEPRSLVGGTGRRLTGAHAHFDRRASAAHDARVHPHRLRRRRRSCTLGFHRVKTVCRLWITTRRSHDVLLSPSPPLASQFSLAVGPFDPATVTGVRTCGGTLRLRMVVPPFGSTERFGFGTPGAAGRWSGTDVHRLPIDCGRRRPGWPTPGARHGRDSNPTEAPAVAGDERSDHAAHLLGESVTRISPPRRPSGPSPHPRGATRAGRPSGRRASVRSRRTPGSGRSQ